MHDLKYYSILFFSVPISHIKKRETVEDSIKIGLDDGGRKDSVHMGARCNRQTEIQQIMAAKRQNHLLKICQKLSQFIVMTKVNIYSFIANIYLFILFIYDASKHISENLN